jgi:hypothetical protein
MIAFVVGKKLSGKTYYTQHFLERTKKPFIVVDSLVEYHVDTRFDNVDDFITTLEKKGDKIKLGNIGLSLPTSDEALEFFAWAWHLNPHILVIEEFHQYGNAWAMPTQLDRLFRMGRHRGIDIIGITQRFSDLPQVARTQADAIIFFQQQGDRDFVAIEKFATAELAERVSKLKPRQHIEYRL